VVEVRQGRAIDSLPKLRAEGLYPFDLIFIDADKASNAAYIDWGLRLSRPGTVIILDNMIRGGGITDGLSADASVRGAREAFDLLGSSTRLSATALQTVGSKGYDGFVMAIVEG
jgi:predicted O-methyltransferase YrrM